MIGAPLYIPVARIYVATAEKQRVVYRVAKGE